MYKRQGVDNCEGIRCNGIKYGMPYVQTFSPSDPHLPEREKKKTPAQREMSCWLDCLINHTQPIIRPEQTLVVSRIIQAIYESQKMNQPVYF